MTFEPMTLKIGAMIVLVEAAIVAANTDDAFSQQPLRTEQRACQGIVIIDRDRHIVRPNTISLGSLDPRRVFHWRCSTGEVAPPLECPAPATGVRIDRSSGGSFFSLTCEAR